MLNVQSLPLLVLETRLAVCRLDPDAALPAWASQGRLFSITRTGDELSVVCDEGQVPDGLKAVKGWRVFRVVGSMDFNLVGVLNALTAPLAQAGVGLFALSTFDTDYLLVQQGDLSRAIAALQSWGHQVRWEGGREPG